MLRNLATLMALATGFITMLEGSKLLITRSSFFGWFHPLMEIAAGSQGLWLTGISFVIVLFSMMTALGIRWAKFVVMLSSIALLPFFPAGTVLGIVLILLFIFAWR